MRRGRRYRAHMNINPWIVGPVAACVAFPLFFGCVLKLISLISGWSRLAVEYGSTEPMPKPRLYMQTGDFRFGCGYGNCLTMAADADALYLRPMWPFGFGHALLRLPWGEAEVTESTNILRMATKTFRFERVPNVPVRMLRRTAEKLVAMASAARHEAERTTSRDGR